MQTTRPKLVDVARAAGVSRTAASRAINGQPGTTPAVRQRVRDAAAQLGFRPHAAARALAAGREDVVEMLIVDPDPAALSAKPYYGRAIAGALRALGGRELRLRLVPEVPADDDGTPFGRILINVPGPAAAAMRSTRVVSLGRSAPGVAFVAPDNDGGARQAATHLLATGRRRLGAVFGPAGSPCAAERRAGFLAVATAAGFTVVEEEGDFTRATAYAATQRMLAAHPYVDAVFAACDVTAIGVLAALRHAGRRVPADVAVVGFDGSSLAEAADLSSVHVPAEDEAALAVGRLLDPDLRGPGRLPTELRLRGSSA